MTNLSRLFVIAIGLGVMAGTVTFWHEYSTCGYQGCSRIR